MAPATQTTPTKIPRRRAGRGDGNGRSSQEHRDASLLVAAPARPSPGPPAGPALWLGSLGPTPTLVSWLVLRARARR